MKGLKHNLPKAGWLTSLPGKPMGMVAVSSARSPCCVISMESKTAVMPASADPPAARSCMPPKSARKAEVAALLQQKEMGADSGG